MLSNKTCANCQALAKENASLREQVASQNKERETLSSVPDVEERRTFWSSLDVARIALEEGIRFDPRYGGVSSIQAIPGMTRSQVVAALRILEAIPEEDG